MSKPKAASRQKQLAVRDVKAHSFFRENDSRFGKVFPV